jgi:hypothetical protein
LLTLWRSTDTVFINDDDEVVGFESGDAGELEEEEPDTVV